MTTSLSKTSAPLTLSAIRRMADEHHVPVEDALLIAINLFGIASAHGRHRARMSIRLTSRPHVPWMVIVPLNAQASPFSLRGDELSLAGIPIGTVERVAADEAVGGYFRDDGRAATLNPNARSRCVGCAFCPNTLEAAADPRLAEERQLSELLAAMTEQHPRRNLRELAEVTVSTGCFERERAAVDHLLGLREVLNVHGVGARIGFLTSVISSRQAFEELAEHVAPFVLRLTAECFSRRDLLLKASKAILTADEMPHVLRRAMQAGHGTSFTYVVGLDTLDELRRGVSELMPFTTEFPNFQVYQAHNAIMAGLRADGSDTLDFYLRARQEIEQIAGPTGLRPKAWECYRPLWYFTFGDESLVAP
ncbi:hypothetical protein [Actinacidiphila sp. ITFR-21]|uniref:hypothetical protein n=1 Tax=Actinacidiphila sp. ITFR-21 TaxID=3075199 RepID=UPI00288B958E|nr:hypothetical protein [Streptomyces sp. ITFR-21]WNI16332.1 hypothetical protein RLT57_12895 [Streptomyces sp. ITFR-21]